jgi:hypothetical protein
MNKVEKADNRKRILTIGYGILTGTHEEREAAFQERLCVVDTGGWGLRVVDIRIAGCGSRNGPFFFEGDQGMRLLVAQLVPDVIYSSLPDLCNTFGGSQAGLKRYREHIAANKIIFESGVNMAYRQLMGYVCTTNKLVVLLCSERKAFKPNGKSWNCHRVPLSLELLEDLGDGWEVEHL